MGKHRGMFWVSVAGVVVSGVAVVLLYFYTRATLEQVKLIHEQSATMGGQLDVMRSQLSEMKSSSEQTERAIKASNRIADGAARTTVESRRLADAMTQATVISNRMADAAVQTVAVSNRVADAAAEGTAESRRLADSAAQATEINRQTLVAVQRPFMFVKDVEFVKFMDSLTFHVRVMWENSGNTPTKDLTVENGCVFSDTLLSDPYNTPEATFWGQKSPRQLHKYQMFVGPKQSTYAVGCLFPTFLQVLNQAFMNTLLPNEHIYLIGRAEYRDTLNPDYLHITEYCRMVVAMTIDDKLSHMTGDTIPCVEHNCADEECRKREAEVVPVTPGQAK